VLVSEFSLHETTLLWGSALAAMLASVRLVYSPTSDPRYRTAYTVIVFMGYEKCDTTCDRGVTRYYGRLQKSYHRTF
jgi:hypothetical protein